MEHSHSWQANCHFSQKYYYKSVFKLYYNIVVWKKNPEGLPWNQLPQVCTSAHFGI
jgi:hypothetical protein